MKYYAVTEDPRELYHYGVKGMKWGQHIFGPEPGLKKSDAYKRSLQKLRSLSSKGVVKATGKALKTSAKKVSSGAKTVGSAIQKSAAQISYNRRVAQQNKFNKAVEKAQKRNRLSSTLRELDNEEKYRKQLARDQKIESLREKQSDIMAKNDLKSLRRAVKVEKHMPKYFQEARTGTLKYGKLSDEQIGRLQDRLALEASTRRLGSTEPMSWRQQKKAARRRGYLEGISKGTAAAMEEVARAGAQYGVQHIMNRKKLDKASEYKAQREKEASRIKNKKTHSEVREDLRDEAYETQIRAGKKWRGRSAANTIKRIEAEQHEERRKQAIQDKIKNETDEKWNKYLEDNYLTDKQALALERAKPSDANADLVRRRIMAKQDYMQKAIDKATVQKLQENAIAEQEQKNAQQELQRRKDQYKKEIDAYNEAKRLDKEAQDEYEKAERQYAIEDAAYQQAVSNGLVIGSNIKPPKKPKKPKLKNPVKPSPIDTSDLDAALGYKQTIFSLEELLRMRELGINVPYLNNGNGKKKNK